MANKQEYTLILAYANTLAKASGYKQAIRPINKWARPTDQATVGAFSLTSAGILTAAESCVISNFRLEYTLIAEGARASMLLIFADIASKLNLKTVGEVVNIVQDTAMRLELMTQLDIPLEFNETWKDQLQKVNIEFDIPAAKELMQEHLITFIMAMRHSPDWDYEHTNQLSKDEREGILAFVSSEEGVVPLENEDEEDFNNSTIKKP